MRILTPDLVPDLSRVRSWAPGQCQHVWIAGFFLSDDGTRCRLPTGHDGRHKPVMPAHVVALPAPLEGEGT